MVARTPTVAPFPTDPALTAIALAYRNEMLIADSVLPRVPVGKQEFRYNKMNRGDQFTPPDDRVGRRSKPNMAEYGFSEEVGKCDWHALDGATPNDDISNAPEGYDPVGQAVQNNRELIALNREVRVAAKVFNGANYATGNKRTLATTARWSQSASKPIDDIEDAKDAMIMRPTALILGRSTWRYLSTHAEILKSINRSTGDKGIATRRAVAELFELEEVLVGEGWLNTGKPGQAEAMSRVWGPHALLIHRNKNANTQGGTTFGYTAQWGSQLAGQWPDKDIGATGGVRSRTGECVGEVIMANDLGYLFTNAGDNS